MVSIILNKNENHSPKNNLVLFSLQLKKIFGKIM